MRTTSIIGFWYIHQARSWLSISGGHCRKNVTEAEPKNFFSEQINIGDVTPPVAKKFSVSVPF